MIKAIDDEMRLGLHGVTEWALLGRYTPGDMNLYGSDFLYYGKWNNGMTLSQILDVVSVFRVICVPCRSSS